jgi:hypothetical protein
MRLLKGEMTMMNIVLGYKLAVSYKRGEER